MSKFCFIGASYATKKLREAAIRRGLDVQPDPTQADCLFVSQDTPTDQEGNRDLDEIRERIRFARGWGDKTIILTSQVPPGFCRENGVHFHQAETLRIEDGAQRAMYPEQIIVGSSFGNNVLLNLPLAYAEYLDAFQCPVVYMTLEEAEFAKIAINYFLAKQVDTTNELAERAELCGANWGRVARALRNDSRIGKYAYLTPGDWRKSIHLLRDYVTLDEIKPL